jgi:hypothetical protein
MQSFSPWKFSQTSMEPHFKWEGNRLASWILEWRRHLAGDFLLVTEKAKIAGATNRKASNEAIVRNDARTVCEFSCGGFLSPLELYGFEAQPGFSATEHTDVAFGDSDLADGVVRSWSFWCSGAAP